jgi:hypothetical protein
MIKVCAEPRDLEEITRFYHKDHKTGFGSAPYLAHIGLKNAIRIRQVDVYWPVTKRWKSYSAEIERIERAG